MDTAMAIENKIKHLIENYAFKYRVNYLFSSQCILDVLQNKSTQKITLNFRMDTQRVLQIILSFKELSMEITVGKCCLLGFELNDCIQLFSDWHTVLIILIPELIKLYQRELELI